ncbi:MAG: 30S ribosomal protein S4 [Chlorobium limicola]|jgi:small subunit ribosomal protein S4|uniref:Small ribosomal subunit protein uS4 n=1 Tax=Chlorobium limicola (strain DSM 245 / NBRC 103803 / 6330) TaxID=290315 RepID=RS4_CHLL2|nr:30S ribosomal protein S4 [Chlorobium limicola]B3EGW4.1 RecName: Full=Small ribosomal subunit protein uS4; AltName: Full=30S ribosomal protein S4 [Chlorobium limicola DSM 245]ACD91227.1 ribosomal protein S4 [Chlorobium limicola DSM 245]NTV08497.1 30S ribosomal protein S4 [Chlorobium limicola]NTV20131.1 30S ribosomal protein S4 [Chlorobium limicola]
MARFRGSITKVSRRLGVALSPKAEKYLERRPFAPGQHGQSRKGKVSEYALQLREKQKMKYLYGILEKQFRNYYKKAVAQRGVTGDNLVKLLERRLDNVVFRSGFSASRAGARQLVSHGHLVVNGKKVNIPSFQVSPGDLIEFRQRSRNMGAVTDSLSKAPESRFPSWIQVDKANQKAVFLSVPEREDIQEPFNEQLVVELYSK